LNVFFDVLGTLRTMEVPRPRAREAFLRLKEEGHDLYLWSSGGAGYRGTRRGRPRFSGWRTWSKAASTNARRLQCGRLRRGRRRGSQGFRDLYEALDLRVVAHKDRSLEVTWSGGEDTLRCLDLRGRG
jgi:hypothetical protein